MKTFPFDDPSAMCCPVGERVARAQLESMERFGAVKVARILFVLAVS